MKQHLATYKDWEDIHQTGVYKIFHLSNHKNIYVGSATKTFGRNYTKGFYSRWAQHIFQLKRGIHHSNYLQNIINKHGIEGLRFKILKICNDPDHTIKSEQTFLDTLRPKLNSSKSATTSLGFRHSVETLARFSVQRRGRKKPPMTKETKAKMFAIGKSRDLSYLRSAEVLKKKSELMKGISLAPDVYERMKKAVLQYDLQGNFICEYASVKEAAEATNTNRASISRVINGKWKSVKGFTWTKKKES